MFPVFHVGFQISTLHTTLTYKLLLEYAPRDHMAQYTCTLTFPDLVTDHDEFHATNHPGYTFTHNFAQIDIARTSKRPRKY